MSKALNLWTLFLVLPLFLVLLNLALRALMDWALGRTVTLAEAWHRAPDQFAGVVVILAVVWAILLAKPRRAMRNGKSLRA